ncbi:hypothetical protein BK799_29125 [Rhodococcus sp. D-1]|nr:hypothetical protein BK799_29125 [Rhodococcus sp. D-1]
MRPRPANQIIMILLLIDDGDLVMVPLRIILWDKERLDQPFGAARSLRTRAREANTHRSVAIIILCKRGRRRYAVLGMRMTMR